MHWAIEHKTEYQIEYLNKWGEWSDIDRALVFSTREEAREYKKGIIKGKIVPVFIS